MIIWQVAISELGESYVNNHLKPIIEDPKEANRNYSNIYEYACWADDAKTTQTGPWHYYDIPFFDEGYHKDVVLNKTDNVAWAINIAKDTL